MSCYSIMILTMNQLFLFIITAIIEKKISIVVFSFQAVLKLYICTANLIMITLSCRYDYPIVPVRDLPKPFRLTGPPCRDTYSSPYIIGSFFSDCEAIEN